MAAEAQTVSNPKTSEGKEDKLDLATDCPDLIVLPGPELEPPTEQRRLYTKFLTVREDKGGKQHAFALNLKNGEYGDIKKFYGQTIIYRIPQMTLIAYYPTNDASGEKGVQIEPEEGDLGDDKFDTVCVSSEGWCDTDTMWIR